MSGADNGTLSVIGGGAALRLATPAGGTCEPEINASDAGRTARPYPGYHHHNGREP